MIDRLNWQRLSALLDEALVLDDGARAAWLAALQQREPELGAQLARMLPAAAADRAAEDGDDPEATLPGLQAYGRHLQSALQRGAGPGAGELPSLAGRRLGPWLLVSLLGQGGMGQVWLATRDDGLYRAQAAIKLLRPDLNTGALAGRFARERAVLARLNHPAVARLLDAGVADDGSGQAYLVLEHVPGRQLGEHARLHCPQLAQRVRLLLRVAQAVEHAHAQLIVHRDLKPSNVIVTPEGEPKLLDFGIAGLLDDDDGAGGDLTRQTGRGLTLGYAAPEQILGAPIGTAADVFSLGVMLFELMSGELPFAPRGAKRVTLEHAVLHDEPRRLTAVLGGRTGAASKGLEDGTEGGPESAAPADPGPGRPQDAERARGDLEAIAAKALRKQPAERYASVGAFIEDLERWLTHRPVSARRDDWRHRTGLWLRRNAVLAGALAVVGLSLAAGLAVSTWQWQRAEAAARSSERIAGYLTELLASASPDRHGGQWPTVLQLLEGSRAALPRAFVDDPETRMRLLAVLADTYNELNRFDIAMPLNAELVALATQRHGEHDALALQARARQGRTYQVQGLFDKAIATLEPLQEPFVRSFGAESEERRRLLYTLSTSYARAGRLDDADRLLAEAGGLTERRHGRSSPQWMAHLNHLQVLRAGQGRLREALAAIRSTEPFWGNTDPANQREILVYRRNTLAIQIRLGEYDGIETRTRAVLADMDRLLGRGNDMATGLRHELARFFTETGDTARALQQRQDNLARAVAAGVEHPAVLLPLQVHVALARAQAHAATADELRREARALLAQLAAERQRVGYARADAWINLARIGLLLDDAALAAEAVQALRSDDGLALDRDRLLAGRLAQIEGALTRLQGDLARSRTLLQQRLQTFERPGIAAGDRQVLPAWVATLDLAYTLALQQDAGAAAALQAAAGRRPPGAPAGHPLDAVARYLAVMVEVGANHPKAQAAADELARLQRRRPAQPPGAGLGSLGGAFI